MTTGSLGAEQAVSVERLVDKPDKPENQVVVEPQEQKAAASWELGTVVAQEQGAVAAQE